MSRSALRPTRNRRISTRERHELATEPQAEEDELTSIYIRRGLEPELARIVARQLMAKGALAAHARDELGLTEELAARPLQAALASAATFAVGAAVPILAILVAPISALTATVAAASLVCLVVLGATAAFVGGAPILVGAARVTIWGLVAMLATADGPRVRLMLLRHRVGVERVRARQIQPLHDSVDHLLACRTELLGSSSQEYGAIERRESASSAPRTSPNEWVQAW